MLCYTVDYYRLCGLPESGLVLLLKRATFAVGAKGGILELVFFFAEHEILLSIADNQFRFCLFSEA